MTQTTAYTVFFILLCACAVCDFRTCEVPLPLTGAALSFSVLWRVFCGGDAAASLFSGAAVFGILMIGVIFFSLGGADALLGGAVSVMMGFTGAAAVMLAFMISIPFMAVRCLKGRGREPYPFIPFLAAAFAATAAACAAAG